MPALSFRARIRLIGVNPYVHVSAARARAIKPDWRKPLPVLVRIDDKPEKNPWQLNLMPVGKGAFYLYLHGEVRRVTNTAVGDTVHVAVEFNAAYRNGPQHPMPAWFRAPLSDDARAKKAWQALPPSRKKEVLRYFARLKSVAARSRNATLAVAALSGKPGKFMGRTWSQPATRRAPKRARTK
jgi:hypothetical protein